jgi:hypothetical protein
LPYVKSDIPGDFFLFAADCNNGHIYDLVPEQARSSHFGPENTTRLALKV